MVSLQDIATINPKSNSLQNTFIYIDLEAVEKGELKKIQEIMREEAPSRAQRVIDNNDILFQCVRPYQKNNYIHKTLKWNNKQWVASTGYAQIRTKESPSYIYHLLNTDGFNKKVLVRCTGSSYPAINSEDLATIRFYYTPTPKEQFKISRLLDLIDDRIATQNKIIEDLKKLKSAIIDTKILRNQTAVTIRLSEACKEAEQIKESSPSFDRIISVRLHANGVHQSNADNLELGATQYYIRKSGQLIYGKQNFHNGAIGIIPESLDGGLTSKDIPSFDIFQDKVNPIYLVCYMQHPSFYEPIEALTTGSGSKRLKERDFLNLQIHLPNKEVQDEIAHSLTVLVSKIDLESRILDLYTKQRSYLLSQMFI